MTNKTFNQTIWLAKDGETVQIIDQRYLPHQVVIENLKTAGDVVQAIKEMRVRGAPLIGVTAAFGMYLAALESKADRNFDSEMLRSAEKIKNARPTAVNLAWAVERVLAEMKKGKSKADKIKIALRSAKQICAEDIEVCRNIGRHGLPLIEALSKKKNGKPVNVLTHCNAGWLACVEWGTATSAIYQAFEKKIPVHVWVTETRPRRQGASLTAWELGERGISHTLIVDGAVGHVMQRRMVDLVIVGTDRTAANGDVANKIGTYMVALAAKDNKVPFYVALPSSSLDFGVQDGIKEIPIEERDSDEVKTVRGRTSAGFQEVWIAPEKTKAANYAFDVTPARLITGLITERGIAAPNQSALRRLFPQHPKRGTFK